MAVKEAPGSEAPGRGVTFEVRTRITPGYRLARAIAEGLIRLWFRPHIRDAGNIPASGPVIIAPVHRSNLDFCFSAVVTDRKIFFMAKDSLWRSRAFGWLLVTLGAFPVHRGSADREAMAHAESVLREGQVLVMFPEGSRQESPVVQDLLDGVAFVAARTGAPIVPMGIAGSELSMPKGKRFPARIPIDLVVGAAIQPPVRTDAGRVARSTVRQTTAELRQAIQLTYDQARADRAERANRGAPVG